MEARPTSQSGYSGDLGVVEFGLSSVFSIGSDGWYDAPLRFDMRFVF